MSSKIWKCLSVLALVVATSAAAPADVASAHSGSTNATPANESQGGHWWSNNGCGNSWSARVVADSVPGTFNFRHACIHHDGCYAHAWTTRLGCDVWFYNDMLASCNAGSPWTYWWNRPTCYSFAASYYSAVRAFGKPSYKLNGRPSSWLY